MYWYTTIGMFIAVIFTGCLLKKEKYILSLAAVSVTFLVAVCLRNRSNPYAIPINMLAFGAMSAGAGVFLDLWNEIYPIRRRFVGFIMITIIVTSVAYILVTVEQNGVENLRKKNYEENVTVTEVMEAEEDVFIYEMAIDSSISGQMSSRNGSFSGFLITSTLNSESVYKYLCRNQYGALVLKHVPADENITMIFDTLSDGEQPYIRTIHTYKVITDNNVKPPEEKKEYVCTNYHFFIPASSVKTEFGF